jgi:isopentenyl-diphosphate Delta-isomerase
MTRVIIVDEQDREIGVKERSTITKEDIHRVATVWITSPEGNILLARRALTKLSNPGKWSAAVSGFVDEGETYRKTIIREAAEELGIRDLVLTEHKKFFRDDTTRFFTQWFTAMMPRDTPLTPDPEEVMDVRWWTYHELIDTIAKNPEKFVPNAPQWFNYF